MMKVQVQVILFVSNHKNKS